MTGLVALDTLLNKIDDKMDYVEISSIIESMIQDIKDTELAKLLALGEKFDVNHNNYTVLVERGHIASPTHYHMYLSDYSKEVLNPSEVFDKMDSTHKEQILNDVVKDKDINEQLVAYRHEFDYITHSKGHDGIRKDGSVFEVKNHRYTKPKKDARFSLNLKFDRLSENTLRKLEEGRPEIILNSTDGHKLLIEMKVKFTDDLVDTYKQKLAGVKDKSTSGTSIAFSDFKHAITDVSYICKDFNEYMFSLDLLDFLNKNYGYSFDNKRKSTLCPNVQKVLNTKSKYIKEKHSLGTTMAKIARELTTPTTKISGQHIKRVLSNKL